MKRRQKIAMMLFVTLASATACAKNSNGAESKQMSAYTVSIDGEKIDPNLSEEEIAKITETVEGYLNASVSIDYQNPSRDKEYEYYTKAVAKERRDSGVLERTIASSQNYELKQEFLEAEIQSIELYKKNGQELLDVTVPYKAVFTHSTKEYVEAVGIDTNVIYRRIATVTLGKEDGEWKVVDFSATKREVAKGQ